LFWVRLAFWVLLQLGSDNVNKSPNRSSSGTLAVVGPVIPPTMIGTVYSGAAVTGAVSAVSLAKITWTFLQVGFVFFGGGFVLVPILHERLVTTLGWLTPNEFVDGVAISQLTPGPIAVLATFAGYRLAGIGGALLATVALFTPAVLLMLLISRFYEKLRHQSRVKHFLAGIVPAVVGLIVAAALLLLPESISVEHPATVALGALAFASLVLWNWHPAVLLVLGAVAGMATPSWFG
jgi:chromate transporter